MSGLTVAIVLNHKDVTLLWCEATYIFCARAFQVFAACSKQFRIIIVNGSSYCILLLFCCSVVLKWLRFAETVAEYGWQTCTIESIEQTHVEA